MKKLTALKTSPLRVRVNKECRELIKDCFKYDKTYWKKVYGQKRIQGTLKDQFLITGNNKTGGSFWFGSLPRVIRHLAKLNYELVLTTPEKLVEVIPVERQAKLPTITFRPDQQEAIAATGEKYFGRIIAPTRSGKTIVQLGIMSQFPSKRILLLAHTKDLVSQLCNEAIKYSNSLPKVFAPKTSKEIKKQLSELEDYPGVMICTIQSISNLNPIDYGHIFDIVMVDEGHHVNKKKSRYGKLLMSLCAPRRYAFTATPPTSPEEELFNEGMFGDIIAELTVDEAFEKGIITKPVVRLQVVPFEQEINLLSKNYQDYYQLGIVENTTRNKIIVDIVDKSLQFKYPTLIIVERVEQGKQIKNIIKRLLGIRVPFVKGDTKDTMRESRLSRVKSGKELVTICSRIWMEGITMQNLKVVIYAAGMKEKKRVIQAMGRGLGLWEGKENVILYDFLDPYRYLAEHSIARQSVYLEEGWLKWTS